MKPVVFSAMICLFVGTSIRAQPGLVGYWKFDEPSGTIAWDSSGSGHQGTLMGSPQRVAGKSGGALDFNDTTDYVRIAADPALNNLNAVTFSAWILPRADSHWHVVDKGDGDKRLYSEGLRLTLDGRVRYGTTHAVSQSDSHTIVLNVWQHVAMTWSAASETTRLYYNGTEVGYSSMSIGSGTINNDSDYAYTIGARGALGAATFFNGLIDEVRIYNRVLTPQEVSGLSAEDRPSLEGPCRLSVAPNPLGRSAAVRWIHAAPYSLLKLYDVSGSLVRDFGLVRSGVTWDAQGLPDGVYIFQATTDHGRLSAKAAIRR